MFTFQTALVTSSLKAFNLMRKDYGGRGGTILNISSVVALIPGIVLPIYSATKSAVLQFSTSLGVSSVTVLMVVEDYHFNVAMETLKTFYEIQICVSFGTKFFR